MSRKQTILNEISDSVTNFLYYDRKGSETLPMGSIESSIKSGEITVDDMVQQFKKDLEKGAL